MPKEKLIPNLLFFNKDKKRRIALVEKSDIAPEECEDTIISPIYSYLKNDGSKKPIFALSKRVIDDSKVRDKEAELTQPFFKAKQVYTLSDDDQLTKLNKTVLLQRIPGKDGYTLYDEILKKIESNKKRLKILIQIEFSLLYNLKAIHEQQILHRDLKIENIITYPYFNPDTHHIEFAGKIIDFDLSRKYEDKYCIDVFVGSTSTASPETLTINTRQNYHSDIYSLGISFGDLLDADDRAIPLETNQISHKEIEINQLQCLTEDTLDMMQQVGLERLKVMIGDMCRIQPKDRATLEQCINEFSIAYKNIMGKPYKPLHKIKTHQTKLDKLLENITILTGLQAEPLFRSDDWQKLFDVYRYQINDYASINKVDRVITDKDENLKAHKQALLQTVNQFVQDNLSQKNINKETGAANFKNLKAVCRLIYGLQTCKKQSMLQEKIGRVADSLEHTNPLRAHLLDWLEQHIDLKTSFGAKM